jgi:hypothetical protein
MEEQVIADQRIISFEDAVSLFDAMRHVQLEFDIRKRYIDEERAHTVGLAQYEIVMYSRNGDTKKRFEK